MYYIFTKHFLMVTLERILQQGVWFASMDLSDAYFHIAVRQDHHRFLRFAIGDQVHEFTALPFGLSTAPGVFMKCMMPLAAHLRTLGIFGIPLHRRLAPHITIPTASSWPTDERTQIGSPSNPMHR